MTEPEFIRILQDFIKAKYKTNSAAAKAWGVSPQFVSQVLRAKSESRPNKAMIDDCGFEKSENLIVEYSRVK